MARSSWFHLQQTHTGVAEDAAPCEPPRDGCSALGDLIATYDAWDVILLCWC